MIRPPKLIRKDHIRFSRYYSLGFYGGKGDGLSKPPRNYFHAHVVFQVLCPKPFRFPSIVFCLRHLPQPPWLEHLGNPCSTWRLHRTPEQVPARLLPRLSCTSGAATWLQRNRIRINLKGWSSDALICGFHLSPTSDPLNCDECFLWNYTKKN